MFGLKSEDSCVFQLEINSQSVTLKSLSYTLYFDSNNVLSVKEFSETIDAGSSVANLIYMASRQCFLFESLSLTPVSIDNKILMHLERTTVEDSCVIKLKGRVTRRID